MMRPSDVGVLLNGISDIFTVDSDAEITVECHPNTIGERRFREYKSVGVNRVTLGLQSFSDVNLTAIGRDHTSEKQKNSSEALGAGFRNVGMDLMYRLPNQDMKNFTQDLEAIAEFLPDTVSAYSQNQTVQD